MNVARLQAFGERDIIAERRALDDVAIVEQDGVLDLGARRGDQPGGLGEAHLIVGPVAIIIIGENIGVKVAGAHQAKPQAGGRGQRAARLRRYKGGCGALQGGAAIQSGRHEILGVRERTQPLHNARS